MSGDPDRVTSIDVTLEKPVRDDLGHVFCGEGSYGSEGFFGLADRHRHIVWVVYLEGSNPFVGAAVSDTSAVFTTSSWVSVTVNLEALQFRALN